MVGSLIPFQEGGKWGYKDEKGQEVIKPKLDGLCSQLFSRDGSRQD